MGGWGIIAADVIVMANLAQIAGSYGFRLFGLDSLADSTFWTTVAGIGWIVVMTYICYRGIEVSARIQYALLGIELVVLVVFARFALVKVYAGTAPAGSLHPSLSWLWPVGPDAGRRSPTAVLLAVFIYWGWDTAVAINEETDGPGDDPGPRGGHLHGPAAGHLRDRLDRHRGLRRRRDQGIGLGNEDNADDVFNASGAAVFGTAASARSWSLLIISVLTSASASTQTTILPTARTALSMGPTGRSRGRSRGSTRAT